MGDTIGLPIGRYHRKMALRYRLDTLNLYNINHLPTQIIYDIVDMAN